MRKVTRDERKKEILAVASGETETKKENEPEDIFARIDENSHTKGVKMILKPQRVSQDISAKPTKKEDSKRVKKDEKSGSKRFTASSKKSLKRSHSDSSESKKKKQVKKNIDDDFTEKDFEWFFDEKE